MIFVSFKAANLYMPTSLLVFKFKGRPYELITLFLASVLCLVNCYCDIRIMWKSFRNFFNFNFDVLILVHKTKLSLALITDSMSSVHWLISFYSWSIFNGSNFALFFFLFTWLLNRNMLYLFLIRIRLLKLSFQLLLLLLLLNGYCRDRGSRL